MKIQDFKKRNNKIVIIGFILAAISLLHCLYYVKQTITVIPYGYDENNYIACALRLIDDKTFSFWGQGPDAYVSPMFPLFLSFVFRIFGRELRGIIAVRIIQSILLACSTFFCYILSYKLTRKPLAAISGGLFLAINGPISYYATFFLTEVLCMFFTLAFLNLFYDSLNGQPKKIYFAGLLYAASMLTRPPIAALIPFFVFMMWKKTNRKQKLIFAAGILTLVAPWCIRNVISLHQFVLFSTQTNAFFYGFCEDPVAMGLSDPGSIWGNIKLIGQMFAKDPMGELYYMTIGKFNAIFTLHEELTVNILRLSELDYQISHLFIRLGFVGLLGGLFSKKYRRISVAVMFSILTSFLVVSTVRYGFPVYPFLGMFAGLTIDAVIGYFAKEQSHS